MTPTDTTHEDRAPLVELLPEAAAQPALLQVVVPPEWTGSNSPDVDPQQERAALVELLPDEAVLPALMQNAPPQDWMSSNSPAVSDSDHSG